MASFSLYDPFAHALGAEVNNAASIIYAVEGSCFVLAPRATVSKAFSLPIDAEAPLDPGVAG